MIAITKNKNLRGNLFVKTEDGEYFFGPENNKGVREFSTTSKIPLLSQKCRIIALEVGKKMEIQYYTLKSRDRAEQKEQIYQRGVVNLIELDDSTKTLSL